MKTISHRGAGFLEPENSLRGVRRGIDLGADFIEIDVQITSDGHLVVFHDHSTERFSDSGVYVSDMTLEELKEVKPNNEEIPTLEEVFQLVKGVAGLVIDLKSNVPEEIVEAVDDSGVKDIIVITRHKAVLMEIKSRSESIKTGFLVTEHGVDDPVHIAKEARADYIFLGKKRAEPHLIKAAHKAGLKVAIGEYNSELEIVEALKLNPDAMGSDNPELLVQVVKKIKRVA